jgi:ectoine hydroxylase-related dioxygenase (phytanoyl-CoA dioxygenase family)
MNTQQVSSTATIPHQLSGGPMKQPQDAFIRLPMDQEKAGAFFDQGFLVAEEALSPEQVEELRAETIRLARNADGTINGIDPAPAEATDDQAQQRVLCVHHPHKISQTISKYLSCEQIVDVLTHTVSPNVKCMQSMLFIKAAGKPGQAWHQDEDYIPTRDRSLIGAWIALDDATVDNGCLWVIPGSHKPGILWEQEWHGDRRFDCALESRGFPYTSDDEIPVEVKAGSIVFFNGYLLHRSLPNRRETGYRRSLVNHYCSAETFLPWRFEEGTPMAKQDYRDIVMVAGEDPFAYKGTKEIAKPGVRPSGEGGCESWGGNKYQDELKDEAQG